MKVYKHLFAVLLSLMLCPDTHAQKFSYVYIQGDKQIPFYVKLDDMMMPRYGKNYCIISQLAPGTVTIQILFQQNAFPEQKFNINIPENGYRGFLLLKKNNAFTLYDIQGQYYIRANNKIEEDHTPVYDPSVAYVPTGIGKDKKTAATPAKKTLPRNNSTGAAKPNNKPPVSSGPKFIENIELNSRRTVQPEANTAVVKKDTVILIKPTEDTITAIPVTISNTGTIINSDCPTAMDNDAVDAILRRAIEKADDARLKYLLTKLNGCYNTTQVSIIAKTLTNDPERYTYLKRVYPRVTDQGAFPALENLLSTEEWKGYFRLIIP